MKSILYKEWKTIRREKHLLWIYAIVLALWGILQPIAALYSIIGTRSMYSFTEHFFYSTNFITLSAFFLMMSVTHSNQTFIGEKHARALNTILASPIRVQLLVLGKWVSVVMFVSVMAMVIFVVQWTTYWIAIKVTKLAAPFLFPSFLEVAVSFGQLILLWGAASWYGAFSWLKFETFQAANIVAIVFVLPLLAVEYAAIEYATPLIVTVPTLVLVNAVIAIVAMAVNSRDRLSQLT